MIATVMRPELTKGWNHKRSAGKLGKVTGGRRHSLHGEVGSDGVLPQLTVLGCVTLFRLCASLKCYLVVFSTIGENEKECETVAWIRNSLLLVINIDR